MKINRHSKAPNDYNINNMRLAATTFNLSRTAGTYDLFTCSAQHVVAEGVLVRIPTVNVSDDSSFTSFSVQTDDTTAQEFIPSNLGTKSNLTAHAQISWRGISMIDVGKKIQISINGGAADSATVVDAIVEYRPVVDGGLLI